MKRLVTTGRVITGLFFVLAGINKLLAYDKTLDAMDAAGLPIAALLLPCVIALELGAGLVVLTGRWPRALLGSATLLILFTLMTNLVFHRFWEFDEPLRTLELSLFFKNLVVAAALLMIAGHARNGMKKPA